jgi:acetyltransferase-like isoleucine patch superfamily enzyme
MQHRAKFPFGSNFFFRAWGKRVYSFPELIRRNTRRNKLIRRGAKINEIAEIGELVFDGNKKNLSVGELSFIGKVYMAGHAAISVGKRVCINDGVTILTASHDVLDPEWKHTKAAVIIEDYVWIGTNAMILPGVQIGRGAVVGAAAVVTKSVAAGTIVAGNPARPISKTRTKDLNYNPCEFLAANRAWLIG